MCGIIGVVGATDALPLILNGLGRLDYRGYDSGGVALLDRDTIWRRRRAGKLSELVAAVGDAPAHVSVGIGHTRWATHGAPNERNAHPHLNGDGTIAVIHNGIIENYLELGAEIEAAGCERVSETDTEVLAHLIGLYRKDGLTLADAARKALGRIEGSYAVVIMDSTTPEYIVAARNGSPLIAGLSDTVGFVASDIPAILSETREIYVMDDGQVVELGAGTIRVTDLAGVEQEPQRRHIDWTFETAEKAGYDDFMLKEINEQPTAVRETLRGRVQPDHTIALDLVKMTDDDFRRFDKVVIVACGTSYHAGLVAKYAIEHWARIPVEVDIASEFRYRDPVLDDHTLVVGISQSGESKDTIEACNEARRMGAKVLAVSNVVDSSMTRDADAALYTRAGLEVGVAATKTHVAQLVALHVLALYFAQVRKTLYPAEALELLDKLRQLPELVEEALGTLDQARKIAAVPEIAGARDFFFLGRGPSLPVALEGALKLKEISYVRAEGYPAGELKHGPIALIEPGTVVIAIATKSRLLPKMISNIQEVKARGTTVVGVITKGDAATASHMDYVLEVPETHELFSPVIDVVPLQLFAYALAKARANDVDKPRNLAKTVTVE
jgi:glucosamine--fructose-6-phosphate aminotransferase (isomerizing)